MPVSIDGNGDRPLTGVHNVYFIPKVCFPFSPSHCSVTAAVFYQTSGFHYAKSQNWNIVNLPSPPGLVL